MIVKILLLLLGFACTNGTFAQQAIATQRIGDMPVEPHSELSSASHQQVFNAPPRKEIRHKIIADGSQEEHTPMQRASGEYIMTEFPTEGHIKGVVILAAFADVPFSTDSANIKTILNNRYNTDNYTEHVQFNEYSEAYDMYCPIDVTIPGSARDYFRDQSFGRFVPTFDVIGPVTLDHPRAYYGANNNAGNDKNTSGMIREACQKAYAMGLTDFTEYDNDGDGTVDIVYVVYAGSDEAQTGIEECIWAKASNITYTLGEMTIGRYACSAELVIDLPVVAGIGTFVHEFSHVLGLPDFYNTKETDFTMDIWSVMDYGMYNAEGFVPCAYTAFERYSLGWIPMHTLDAPTTMSIGSTNVERKGFRIFTSEIDPESVITEADTASFYLIETICREGWNSYTAAEGLLISEVTYSKDTWKNNTINADSQHRHCIVPANNDYYYKTAPFHLFGNENHTFTLTSTPASRTQFGVAMDKPLTDIRYDATSKTTSFHFCKSNATISIPTVGDTPYAIPYDLSGRPLTAPSQGIYIQDTKKYWK